MSESYILLRRVLIPAIFVFLPAYGFVQHKSIPAETYVSDPNSVPFDIAPLSGTPSNGWTASFTAEGETARFLIEFEVPKKIDTEMNLPISSGKGRFAAVDGSKNGTLLARLRRALYAKKLPVSIVRTTSLPFTYVNFGANQSQALDGGGFTPNPPGHWTVNKLFIGEGENECEVFLNLNPVLKKGQFSIKDDDYGDVCLAQLAKVL